MPEITGDTANGKSIRVVSRFLPRKSNCVIAHDAASQNHVERHRNRCRKQRELDRRARLGIGNRRKVESDAFVECFGEDRE
jgi:hypothetical protein